MQCKNTQKSARSKLIFASMQVSLFSTLKMCRKTQNDLRSSSLLLISWVQKIHFLMHFFLSHNSDIFAPASSVHLLLVLADEFFPYSRLEAASWIRGVVRLWNHFSSPHSHSSFLFDQQQRTRQTRFFLHIKHPTTEQPQVKLYFRFVLTL